jgi:uncharacterized protein YndB with AHSA1/START domain
MQVQRSIEIKAPLEKIWLWLTEPEKIMKWFTLLKKFEYTGEQRGGAGTTFYYEEKSSGGLMKMHYKVTEWEENRKIAFGVTSGSLKKDNQIWSLEPTPTGSRFTMFEDLEMPMGIFGKIIGALFGQMMVGKNMEKILANLKRVAEG